MAVFTVLEAPDRKPDRVVFIREGFSWGAAAFTVFWALWRRMWLAAAILLALLTALGIAVDEGLIAPAPALAINFGVAFFLGLEARWFEVLSHERSGYRNAGLIEASCREAAELFYFAARAREPVSGPAPRQFNRAPEDTLGIFGNV